MRSGCRTRLTGRENLSPQLPHSNNLSGVGATTQQLALSALILWALPLKLVHDRLFDAAAAWWQQLFTPLLGSFVQPCRHSLRQSPERQQWTAVEGKLSLLPASPHLAFEPFCTSAVRGLLCNEEKYFVCQKCGEQRRIRTVRHKYGREVQHLSLFC